MKLPIHYVTLVLFLLAINVGCASIQEATKTKTYIASSDQLEQIRQLLNVNKCPPNTDAVAFVVESAQGGATLTIRCQ